jgi:hypothetical protein
MKDGQAGLLFALVFIAGVQSVSPKNHCGTIDPDNAKIGMISINRQDRTRTNIEPKPIRGVVFCPTQRNPRLVGSAPILL